MARRKRRYYDSYDSVKGFQWKVDKKARFVDDDAVHDLVNGAESIVRKRSRSRIGHVEKKNGSR